MLVIGAGGFEIKYQYLEPPEQLPYRFIVRRRVGQAEIGTEYDKKIAHALRREARAGHVCRERRAIGHLAGPVQDLLAGMFDACRCPRDGDCKYP